MNRKTTQLLQDKSRDELNLLAKRLKLPSYRKLSKLALVDALAQHEGELSTMRPISWWGRYHNHVYGVATIIGLILAVVFFIWPRHPQHEETSKPLQVKQQQKNIANKINSDRIVAGESRPNTSASDSIDRPLVHNETPKKQTVKVENSPGSVVYQAGRDLVVNGPQKQRIESIHVEARITCTIKTGQPLPPEKIDIGPFWGGDAELRGSAEEVILKLASPILFSRQINDRLIVVNRFYLPDDSPLKFRPMESLVNLKTLHIPITTVINDYASAIDHIKLLEVSITINANDPEYKSYTYDVEMQEGKQISIDVPINRK